MTISTWLSLNLNTISQPSTAAAPTYDTDAAAYFAAVVSNGGAALSTPTKAAFNDFIVGLKADTVWDPLDRLAWFGNESAIAALTDVRQPAKTWQAASGPTFAALAGYTGDGSAAFVSAIDNMSTSAKFLQDNASYGVFQNGQSAVAGLLSVAGAMSGTTTRVRASSNSSSQLQLNTAAGVNTAAVVSRVGMFSMARNDAVNMTGYRNGANAVSGASASVAVLVSPAAVLRASAGYTADRVMMTFYGAFLTGPQTLALYNRVITLATALGVPLS